MGSQEKHQTKMFPFITKTWNPVGGECKHGCSYCWAKQLIKKYKMQKYIGEARLFPLELNKTFTKDDFVFVCDMTDLFGEWVPDDVIQRVLDYIAKSPAQFLLLTKNPSRYPDFEIPDNAVCGATIESDLVAKERLYDMQDLIHRRMVSIEPIMDFNLYTFAEELIAIKPEFVAVGYDNYKNGLPEPYLAETKDLIKQLENANIKVYLKTLREKN
jgi:protein gp37